MIAVINSAVALVFTLMTVLLGACTPTTSPITPTRPNIIVVMADDHAQRAISAYDDGLIRTPNIDRLAQEGMLFTQSFVTNSICAPSRAVMLTGQYSHRNGLRDNRDEFDGSQMTFPRLLQDAGYETALIGKWHLKTEPGGFDRWKVLAGQGRYYGPVFSENGVEVERDGYVTDVITDLVLEFFDTRDRTRPFLLLYNHKAPHRNWMPDTRHLARFSDDLPLPPTFNDDYAGRPAARTADMRIEDLYLSFDMKLHPKSLKRESGTGGKASWDAESSWERAYSQLSQEERARWDAHYGPGNRAFADDALEGEELRRWMYQRYIKDYLRCVVSVDDNLGRVLNRLDELGLSRETIVVYTSDQGFFLGEHGWYDKRFMYEESMRTPLIIRYPDEIAAGSSTHRLVVNLDIAPTLLDYAGLPVPPEMQGRSLRALTAALEPADWREGVYYHYTEWPHGWHDVRPHYGVRTERYKLMHFYGDMDHWELFDLETDPQEMTNLHGRQEYSDVARAMHEQLAALQREFGDERAGQPDEVQGEPL